jgi:hypothetical protein
MMLRIATPDHAGSREQARSLIQPVPGDLSGETVGLDCSKMIVGTPSFLDEVVKQVLELRGAEALEVNDAPERARELLERAAENRGMRDRLRIVVQTS